MSTVRSAVRGLRGTAPRTAPTQHHAARPVSQGTVPQKAYPGDFTGAGVIGYAPIPDGRADPGEIVWMWVTFEENYSQGKDRPVLVIGRAQQWLLGLLLTSMDHLCDRRRDNDYLGLGSGSWDKPGRPSEAELDRVIRVDPNAIRREGAVPDSLRFSKVVAALQTRHGWRAE